MLVPTGLPRIPELVNLGLEGRQGIGSIGLWRSLSARGSLSARTHEGVAYGGSGRECGDTEDAERLQDVAAGHGVQAALDGPKLAAYGADRVLHLDGATTRTDESEGGLGSIERVESVAELVLIHGASPDNANLSVVGAHRGVIVDGPWTAFKFWCSDPHERQRPHILL